ncbi:hypothetical protein OV207_18865 [Corallococcus sp. BB11-1]|uniref:hypothetical protein n=1 Tax=Corallococcus sp. BB11-1 TaxID=2996783 RepID=UPI0022708F9C|nr:hypothetical protein [Corallococcus sp. BB11-1]MCY1033520.1 hypothetical protein [Corallococcus sp. BB11-1]
MKRAGWGVVLGLSCALLGTACEPEGSEQEPQGTEAVEMRISLSGDACGVVSAQAHVWGDDFPTIGPVALYVGNGYIEGGVSNVPSGLDRRVGVTAYNAAGRAVYAGSTYVNVYTGPVSPVQITLMRIPENCPNSGTGSIHIIGVLEGRYGSDGGSAYDAGPGPSYDAGPGPSFDAGYGPRP